MQQEMSLWLVVDIYHILDLAPLNALKQQAVSLWTIGKNVERDVYVFCF